MILDIIMVVLWLVFSLIDYKSYKDKRKKSDLFLSITGLILAISNIPLISNYKVLGLIIAVCGLLTILVSTYFSIKENRNNKKNEKY